MEENTKPCNHDFVTKFGETECQNCGKLYNEIMKHKINPNDPAMPHPNHEGISGLSIRAELAARAMQGILAGRIEKKRPEYISEYAIKCADELIKQLNEES